MENAQNDPRLDPVGTVRQDTRGREAVKVSMGDNTGKGQHVWVVTDEHLDHRWLHHVEVSRWPLVAPQPSAEVRTFRYIKTAHRPLAQLPIYRAHPDGRVTRQEPAGDELNAGLGALGFLEFQIRQGFMSETSQGTREEPAA